MRGLWLLIRISDEKRQEMVQALGSLFAEKAIRPYRRLILQDLNDENLLGWLGYWRTHEALEQFLASPSFRAVKGAAVTLGKLEEVQRLRMAPIRASPDEKIEDVGKLM